jgi:hypothetical protein
MRYFEKLAIFVVTAVLGSNIAAALLTKDWHSSTVLWGLLVTVLGSVVLFLKQNTPTQPLARKIIALFTVVALAIVDAATDHHISSAEVAQILLAFFGAIQVDAIQDGGKPSPATLTV